MKVAYGAAAFLLSTDLFAGAPLVPGDESLFQTRLVLDGLQSPYEIVWGPDHSLWMTEKEGRQISRINPIDGSRKVLLTVEDAFYTPEAQDGLLGLALHPDFLKGKGPDYLYVSYIYGSKSGQTIDRQARLVRYTYDRKSDSLIEPLTLLEGMPGSNDHNSGRLLIGDDRKLYYAIGDQGANQFPNTCKPILAQELPTKEAIATEDYETYQGKILRMELDGSIPEDNPLLNGVRSHIFTFGHRNPQGLAMGPGGILYATEHGPKTDDEINILEAGGNYGWPFVAGYQDDQAYVYGNWSATEGCESLAYSDFVLPETVPQSFEGEWKGQNFKPPMATLFTVPTGFSFQQKECEGLYYICWPSAALSDLVYYPRTEEGIPGWSHSLLITTLKSGSLYRLQLSEDGKSVEGDPVRLFQTANRYRDIALSPDGKSIYIVTDVYGPVAQPGYGWTSTLENPGQLIEIRLKEHRKP